VYAIQFEEALVVAHVSILSIDDYL